MTTQRIDSLLSGRLIAIPRNDDSREPTLPNARMTAAAVVRKPITSRTPQILTRHPAARSHCVGFSLSSR
jgi:hypothetical protein